MHARRLAFGFALFVLPAAMRPVAGADGCWKFDPGPLGCTWCFDHTCRSCHGPSGSTYCDYGEYVICNVKTKSSHRRMEMPGHSS